MSIPPPHLAFSMFSIMLLHSLNLYACQEATLTTGHGTTDWFKLDKEYVKALYCHTAYLTYVQSTS